MDMPILKFALSTKGSGEGGLAQFVKELPPELREELAEGGDFWESLASHLKSLKADLPGELGDGLPDDLLLTANLDADALQALLEEHGGDLPEAGQILPFLASEQGNRPNLLAAAMAQAMGSGGEGKTNVQMQSIDMLMARASAQGEGAAGREGLSVQMAGDSSLSLQSASQQSSGLRVMNLDVPMSQPKWSESVGNRVLWMVNQNVQGAELRLNPPQLGPLEIRVSMEGDRANVQFLAAHAATRDTLDAAIPRLREMFAENGVQLGDVDVSHREGGEGGQSGQDDDPSPGSTQAEGAARGESLEGAGPGRPSGLLDAYA